MAEAGITHAAVFPPYREDGYRHANSVLRDMVAAGDEDLLAFARVGGRRKPVTAPELWMVRRKLRSAVLGRPSDLPSDGLAGFDGVKLLPHLDGIPEPDVFAEIAERGLPVMVHGGRYSDPGFIEKKILPHVPGTLIIAHLGAFPCEEGMLRDAVELARRVPNVYLDTSGAWLGGFIGWAAERVPHKLMFGSDAPLAHPRVAWLHVATNVTSDDAIEDIAWRTAARLLNLPD